MPTRQNQIFVCSYISVAVTKQNVCIAYICYEGMSRHRDGPTKQKMQINKAAAEGQICAMLQPRTTQL